MNVKYPFSLKHPAKTAGAKPHRFSSCGRVSMGTPGKEIEDTVSEMRLGGTSFSMSSVLRLKILCYTLTAYFDKLPCCWFALWLIRLTVFIDKCITCHNVLFFYAISRSGSWTPCVICMKHWQSPRLSSSSTPGERSTGWLRRCMLETSQSLLW